MWDYYRQRRDPQTTKFSVKMPYFLVINGKEMYRIVSKKNLYPTFWTSCSWCYWGTAEAERLKVLLKEFQS